MITYKQGYKYQLVEDYSINTGIEGYEIKECHEFISMTPDGWLVVYAGYAWDGPSGPAIDTRNFMRGSLVHDALYQLIGLGLIGINHRISADKLLRAICEQDGMSALRAWWVYQGVRFGGGSAVERQNPIYTAP